jgi:hypothetical protein
MLGPILAVSIQGVGIGQDLARLDQRLQFINQGRILTDADSLNAYGKDWSSTELSNNSWSS